MSILGTDISGQGNHLVSANILPTDRMNDCPSNNFATLNALYNQANSTLSEGNLKAVLATGASGRTSSTFAVSSGKWYWEVRQSSANRFGMGVFDTENYVMTDEDAGADAYEWAWLTDGGDSSSGILFNNSSSSNHGVEVANGEVIMVALDADNDAIWFGKENSWFNTDGSANSATVKTQIEAGTTTNAGHTSVTGTLTPVFVRQTSADTLIVNFGQDSSFAGNETAAGNTDGNGIGDFAYAPPSGFLALCTKNLPESSVMPQEHFNTLLYTGSGSAAGHRGLGFRPNWIWGKKRGANAQNHWWITDVTDINKQLISDNDGSEGSEADGTAFDVDGFDSAGNDLFYNNNSPYVVWCWKGNGTNTSPSNTNGSINTQATNANIPAGFSITAWAGTGATATVGHGLSQAPQLIIVKNRDDVDNWCVLVNLVGGPDATDFLRLDADTAVVDDADRWNDTAPSATVFTVDTDNQVNGDGDNMVAWCFHSVEGYSKIGKYIGNGNANGPFVYTGFRPAFVLLKPLDDSGWKIFDNKREGFNGDGSNDLLQPNSNAAEGDADRFDILSNGFKNKSSSGGQNENGITFIYMAFAEIPFKYSNGR